MPQQSIPDAVARLKAHLAAVSDLRAAAALLRWDQETHMPPHGTSGRAEQLATLARLAHDLFVSPQTRELLSAAESVLDTLDPDSDEAAIIRMTRRDYDREIRLPAEFVAARARAASLSTHIWQDARRRNDFAAFRPALEEMFDYARRTADYIGFADHPYDALLDRYEPGMTSREVDTVFAGLREATIPLVRAVAARGDVVDDAFLSQEFDPGQQGAFAMQVVEAFGYDLTSGRLDESAHPFATRLSAGDVRITTRYQRRYLPSAIFSIFHESGHAMYEQGVARSLVRTCLDRGASYALHESQSRMWENLVGRSRPFWRRYYPLLREYFPTQLRDVDAEAFYRAVNKVEPSLIRVEADEVTYNLHIMLRYELEKAVLDGSLRAADLPDAWNEKMQTYLGITPPTHADGVMQDIHWSQGSIGYFPTYTLGNIVSVQLFEAARHAAPGLSDDIGQGRFGSLLGWLREHVHRHGRKFLPRELVRRATGRALTSEPYLRYLQLKFGEIYGVGTAAHTRV